jgi:L-malate glycosyltransferase
MSVQRPNICLFTSCFGHGGTENQFAQIVTRVDRGKYNLTVACQRTYGHFYDQVCSAGLEIAEFPTRGSLLRISQSGYSWVRFLQQKQIHLVHAFDFYTNLFAAPLARLARVPVVITSRRDLGIMWSGLRGRALRKVFHWSDCVVANSTAAAQTLITNEKVDPSRVRIVRNGVDLTRFRRNGHQTKLRLGFERRTGTLLVGVIANLRPEKDHTTLFDAIPRVVAQAPNTRFLIIGEGPREADLRVYVRDKGISSYVNFLGHREDIPDLLAEIDIVVLPTSSESLPNVLLEAMSSARPVIASAVGGCLEVIQDGKTGLLVPPADAEALTRAILALLQKPDVRDRISRAARHSVEEDFEINAAARKLEAVYDEMLSQKMQPH